MENLKEIVNRIIKQYYQIQESETSIDEIGYFDKDHFDERFKTRLSPYLLHNVVLAEPNDNNWKDYEKIGTKKIPEEVINKINEGIKKLERIKLTFNDETFISLAKISIAVNKVNMSPEKKERIQKEINYGNKILYIQDPITESNGDIVGVVVRDKLIRTIMFERSHTYKKKYKRVYYIDNLK